MARTRTPTIRPVWVQFAPFVVGAVLLTLAGLALPTERSKGSWHESYLSGYGVYLGLALAVLGAAAYFGAMWSGRRRAHLSAIAAAGAGFAILVLPAGGAHGMAGVVAASIALKPQRPIAYPVRIGLGGVFVLAARVLPIPIFGGAVPLIGVWAADRLVAAGFRRGSSPRSTAAGAVTGLVFGVVSGAAVGLVAAALFGLAMGSDPVSSFEAHDDLGLVMLATLIWATLLGGTAGLAIGPILARSQRRKIAART
jgi:hypothetical protein